jgi:hypothetical protein
MLRITKTFVRGCAEVYDRHYSSRNKLTERELKAWIRRLPPPKYLDQEHFVRLGLWKTRRLKPAYLANEQRLVVRATRQACQATDQILKLHALTALRGVDVTVGAAILHFFYPSRFPIFDIHARKTLRRAAIWTRGVNDSSVEAWVDYVRIMRRLSRRLGVSLRKLDKALYARDRWPRECRRAIPPRGTPSRGRR